MKATVLVRLKTEVLDPQGDAVRRALEKLGFQGGGHLWFLRSKPEGRWEAWTAVDLDAMLG